MTLRSPCVAASPGAVLLGLLAILTGALLTGALLTGEAHALGLEEAMERAAYNGEAAERLRLEVDAADGRRRAALGALMPTLDANASATRNDREVEVGERNFTNLWDTSGSLQARVDLFRGPAIPQWLGARTSVQAAELQARWERSRLRMMAADAWFSVFAAQRNVEAAEDNLALAGESRAQAEARRDTGFGLAADVALARAVELDAEAELLSAVRAREDALDVLAFLVVEERLAFEQLVASEAEGFEASGQPSPPADLQSLAAREDAAARRVQAEGWSFLPTVSLTGSYHVGPSSVRAPDGRYWQVTLGASWRVFDFARYGRLDEARALRDIASLERDEALRARARDLRQAERRVEETARRLELRSAALQAAEESRALVAARFELGEATALELTQADSALFAARTRLNLAALERARAELQSAWLRGALQDEE